MKQGNIPQKLTFFIRESQTISWRWEDIKEGSKEFEVNSCYVSDSDNKKTLETGKKWAGEERWDYKSSKQINSKFDILEFPNKPFNNLRIITLEIRDKGGRAYKVCADIGDKKNLYFDMREDVLLDSIFNVGINPGGIVPGEFIFARVGSQMKPIRVGSFLHDKMIEATEYNDKKVCNLVIGGVYSNKKGDISIYLGQYWAREPKIELNKENCYTKNIKSLSLGNPFLAHVFHNYWGIKYALEGDKKYGIWFHPEDENTTGYHRKMKGDPTAYEFQIVKSHSYKEFREVVNIDIPDNYVEIVKEYNYFKDIKRIQLNNKEVDYFLINHSKLLTISKNKDYVHPAFFKFGIFE